LGFFAVASCVGRGVSGFTVCEQKPGAGLCVCTSYRVQKLQGGRRSGGAGCFVIRARFVCPCQPVPLSRRVCVCVGQLSRRSGDIRTSVRIKCSKVKSATFSGKSCQNFQPNLTEFQPNLKPNLRIFPTES
jgi:hypothetical protein